MKVRFGHSRLSRLSFFEKGIPQLLFVSLILAAASRETFAARGLENGRPVIHNYLPTEYQGRDQNMAAVQDSRGLVYFANRDLILEYDGENWRKIPVPNAGFVHTLAIDADDRIYVGGSNELGYLQTGERGERSFVSLASYLPTEDRDFRNVLAIHPTPEGIYFTASESLFRWSNNQFKVWRLKSPGRLSSHWVANHLFVLQPGVGLLRLERDALIPVSSDPIFSSERNAPMMVARADGSILVCTFQQGLYLLSGDKVAPFPSQVNAFLKANQPHRGLLLQDGSLAIATLLGGVIVLRPDGAFRSLIDESVGLQTNRVHDVLQDHLGSLWLSLSYGLARVEAFAPVSVFASDLGLRHSFVHGVLRHQDQLFAVTDSGLYHLEPVVEGVGIPRFKLVGGLRDSFRALESHSSGLLAGSTNGIYWIRDEKVQRIYPANNSIDVVGIDVLLGSRIHPERVFVGGFSGLRSLRYENQRWQDEGKVTGVDGEVRSIVETTKGDLWLGTLNSGVFRVSFEGSTASWRAPAQVQRYEVAPGLPPNHRWVRVFCFSGHEIFATNRGIYRFDPATQRFQPDATFGLRFANGSTSVTGFASDGQNQVWLVVWKNRGEDKDSTGPQILCGSRPQGGVFSWKPFPSWSNDILGTVEGLSWDPTAKVLWCGTREGLLRFDLRLSPSREENLSTLIHRVSRPGGELLYEGDAGPPIEAPVLGHRQNSIHFEYAAPRWFVGDKNEYQTWLVGFEGDWSDFSGKSTKDYLNLREGQYLFRVRARHGEGRVGQPASFAFAVRPPWYRTIWAYVFYVTGFGGFGFLAVQLRSQALRRHNQELQTKVLARTVELNQMNDELAAKIQALKISEEHAQQVKEKALQAEQKALEASRTKSVFLANMSHELRTPLNSILGFAQLMQNATNLSADDREHLAIIMRSGKHLLGLINDVLSISKIEAGMQPLHEKVFCLSRMFQGLEEIFLRRTQTKGLFLNFDLAPDLPQNVRGDEGKLKQVLINLLSNAIKFTQAGGITLRARWQQDVAAFEVQDSGLGISEADQKVIFEPFTQGPSGLNSGQGTGLGLTISRNFVLLMGGDLRVASTEGQGSTFGFEVRLPATGEAEARLEERKVLGLAPGQPNYRILVADDRWENRAVLVKLLSSVGFQVREAVDGKETLEIWRTWQPHLIWMDMRMPLMDGMEATRMIRIAEVDQSQQRLELAQEKDSMGRLASEFPKHCVVIALTASAFEHNRSAILAAGCDDFVTKPFQNSTVFEKLAKYLGVQFIYEEPNAEPSFQSKTSVLTPDQLMSLPSEWIDQLGQAAALGDDQAVNRIVDQILRTDENLGQELRHMVKKFQFEEIIQLIERAFR